ncbi:sensor histidine kinase [Pseudoxanthomonas dokdonensis]|uniref:histidine kinase n=1 Tax=Pseudoxanthomonas dokdonensis TaxID=344882 RepID=A0A0R0CW35_9GAMM|nr:ATP-binding protein [Pseudoxanthomonas dokdonensis]KRG70602.1 histidine kinase [Pseudoxanthomonas dokdonensis]
MPEALLKALGKRWYLPTVVVALFLIVILPHLLSMNLARDTLDAAKAVSHTYQVEAAVKTLAMDVRDVEAALLQQALQRDADNPLLNKRISEGSRNIKPGLATITRLTVDNPNQQRRLGQLQEVVERRLALFRSLSTAPAGQQAELFEQIKGVQIAGLLDQVLADEHALLAERTRIAATSQKRATYLSWTSMLLQLVVLGTLAFLLSRQVERRLNAERDMQAASGRALAVLQTVREPIALLDAEQTILLSNTAFDEFYGRENDNRALSELPGASWDDPVVLQKLTDVLARGRELWDFEVRQQTQDEVSRVVLINSRRMHLPDSEEPVALLTVSDVTAQKVHEQRVADLNEQLQTKVQQVTEVNRELEAFSYSVSHDLRAPLRHVAGFADKLSRHLGEAADEKSLHYLGIIGSSAKRMSRLIDDLLVYSRLGKTALRHQAVDMHSLVEETRGMLSSGEGNADVEWQIPALPVVPGDENMLRQVWSNLLGNAVKYSSKRAHPKVTVGYEQQADGSHHFSVSDNGTGFDMNYASKLFGVFQRLHKADEFPGSGVGLATVRRVLTRHNGQIWAEAVPDQGATFHFTLPANAQH